MPAPSAELLARIAGIVGTGHVLTDPADTAAFCEDWRRRYRGRTAAVVRPGSTEEVAAVVRAAAAAGVALVPQGGNTGLCGGATPDASGGELVVVLSRLRRVRAVDADNATMTVEAGLTLAEVQQAAQEAGFLFPLSLASEGSCQIGGNLSTNAGGTAVLRYGNARELVRGLEVVLPDGQVWDGLRGLRKDNTGYDLKHLFLGAEGTLGIITAAVLELFPRPAQSGTALAALRDPAAAVALLARLRAALGDRLTGFELVSAVCLDLVARMLPEAVVPLPGHAWYALVQADDSATGADLSDRLESALGAAIEASIVPDAVVARSAAQAQALWALRENISDAQRRESLGIKHDISLPVSRIPEFLQRAGEALAAAFPQLYVIAFGHLGDGNLHYNLSPRRAADEPLLPGLTPGVNDLVHGLVASLGGSISAEHGLGRLKREEIRRYKSAVELELMRRIKDALDPAGLMNPGKVV